MSARSLPALALVLALMPAQVLPAGGPATLRAGERLLSLPAGSVMAMPVRTGWLGLPLWMQRFQAPAAVDVLVRRLATGLPQPALLVEPGRAVLAWFDAPVHWTLQLTGHGGASHGVLSGLTLSMPAASPPGREAGVPSWAALIYSTEAEGADGHRRLQVYAAQRRLRHEHMVAGLRAAGWRASSRHAADGLLRKGDAVMRVYCLPDETANACLLTRESPK